MFQNPHPDTYFNNYNNEDVLKKTVIKLNKHGVKHDIDTYLTYMEPNSVRHNKKHHQASNKVIGGLSQH